MRNEKIGSKLKKHKPWFGRPTKCTNCGDDITDMDEWYALGMNIYLCPACAFQGIVRKEVKRDERTA